MPSEPTAEQLELRRKGRQRLIGAVALALLAVVFVRMLLDPEPRRERAEPLLAIPPRDVAPPLPATPKLPEASAEAGKVVEAAKVAPADAAMAAPATPEPPAAGADRVPAGESRKTVEPKAAEFKKAAPKAAPAKWEPAKAETAANSKASFKVHDFFSQAGLDRSFKTVLDCCFFHTLSDASRAKYARRLRSLLEPNGLVYLLCNADQVGKGQSAVTGQTLERVFASGWSILSVEPCVVEIAFLPAGRGIPGLFACLKMIAA